MEVSFDFCAAFEQIQREMERVRLVESMMSESRVETLNVLVPLCKSCKLLHITLQPYRLKKDAGLSSTLPP